MLYTALPPITYSYPFIDLKDLKGPLPPTSVPPSIEYRAAVPFSLLVLSHVFQDVKDALSNPLTEHRVR